MLTDQHKRLIKQCVGDGYGTAQFALSVERQGYCTEKQFLTMQRLHAAAEWRRGQRQNRSRPQAVRDASFCNYGEGGDF